MQKISSGEAQENGKQSSNRASVAAADPMQYNIEAIAKLEERRCTSVRPPNI